VSTCPIHPGRQAEDGYTLCGRVGIDPDGRNYWTGCLGTLRANLGDLAEGVLL
jgi:hypothetical protein